MSTKHYSAVRRAIGLAGFALLVCLVSVSQRPAAAQSPPPVLYRWDIEQVVTTDPNLPAATLDLALDPDGQPHIVYRDPATGKLMLASRTDTGWATETLFEGDNPSLAIDVTGTPHLTYSTPDGHVAYARRGSNGWEKVREFAAASPANQLALDDIGQPHIALLRSGLTEGAVVPTYAHTDGQTWVETAVAPDRWAGAIALALSPGSLPTVAYNHIEHAGSVELVEVLAASPAVGGWLENRALAYESGDVAYIELLPATLQMTVSNGAPLISQAYGDLFLIKPSPMEYFAELVKLQDGAWQEIARACISCLGYDEMWPQSLSVGAGATSGLFWGVVIGEDLLVGEIDPEQADIGQTVRWQKVAAAQGDNALVVGADGAPRVAFADSEGIRYAVREAVSRENDVFLPVSLRQWAAPPLPGLTSLISVSSTGGQASGESARPSISADGRFVAFESDARNLDPANLDLSQGRDIFIHDRATGRIRNITPASGYTGTRASGDPDISDDGRYVAFESILPLTPDDTDDSEWDVYLYDIAGGGMTLISAAVDPDAQNAIAWGPSLSADGRVVAFYWHLDRHSCIFALDRQTGAMACVSDDPDGNPAEGWTGEAAISANGRYVAFMSYDHSLVANDNNQSSDVFVHDRQTGVTERVSVGTGGVEADGNSDTPSISADGRYVAFTTTAGNLAPGDDNGTPDVYRRDRLTGETIWVSRNSEKPARASFAPSISADGRLIAFESYATFGIAADTNQRNDVFVAVAGERPVLLSLGLNGKSGNRGSVTPELSATGAFVVFKSEANNLVPNDLNGAADIFLRAGFLPVVEVAGPAGR